MVISCQFITFALLNLILKLENNIMPRHSREQSATGIYHVMLRGVNRQSIFEDDEDCIKLINLLRNLVQRFDDKGRPLPALCTIYAYCLMDNHIHLLHNSPDPLCFKHCPNSGQWLQDSSCAFLSSVTV